MIIVRDHGSFRDPSGYVAHYGDRIFRVLREDAFSSFEWLKSSGFLAELVAKKWLVPTDVSSEPAIRDISQRVLEHEPIDFISYPYEWPFELLKRAALFHLDLHLLALESSFTLTDASAYNVQFIGTKPIFIDPLSLVSYSEGQLWFGQRQFCEQFLNPLLLTSLLKIPFNAWYRGSLEGISSEDLARALRPKHKLSWRVWSEVLIPVWLQRSARSDPSRIATAKQRKLPMKALQFMLRNLRTWIAGMRDPFTTETTTWSSYEVENSYLPEEERRKQSFVADFIARLRPRMVWDLGCNTGRYSETALRAGAQTAVGFDSDHGALSLAVQRSVRSNLKFLPLLMDACNPSPSQGWNQKERAGLTSRSKPDAILALAIEHHIAIGRNVPLPMLLDWMTGLADCGVVEFVPKSDSTVQRMLSIRQDIFDQYSQAEFECELTKRAAIEKKEVVSSSGRTLYVYAKNPSRA
ncbi:class I SAM-dependent methyltransferase [Bradyrhizobium canariense]|uniref:Nodulation-related protein NoeA n=1 Tax=Bradyrhizobium canariense TaxID=255045 RepID=A0A1H1N281_9BRAD|nr:class I SAM-dependent methyltransferase [Bradyrhizobium canariense]SDR93096.1 nodulation-related protein NoeA [Bradyrhizobium canariense]